VALARLDQFINRSFLAGRVMVEIIHGKGDGVLQRAVHSYLVGHDLVKNYRSGYYGEGDTGVTVVTMAEKGS